ncbi:mechanosensitive ion channel family protein [Alkalibacter saccharofermentans]|uniref:Mechanosensitive ion channel n=1 Tax=Alkalibacter saccharofermentans DSM 14828 TaxID=1120975 RepID=A0A1M4ZIW7_9FIRM|nr:mechanosensitive ion channel domain-containing protein [Alkalibacter saccharofermentans]SHF17989.1 Mechanosensitive ion channel [Alkalibacter saccharofermentans DSM 14828]
MEKYLELFIEEPSIRKLVVAVIGAFIIIVIKNLIRARLGKYIKDRSSSYKTKKAVNVVGYFAVVVFIMILYSDSLGGVTVVLGIAGAGIAFALQEIIVSIAGWVTILTSDIYKTGDRVLLGGIKGDVIDVGILRTTIMEIASWVDGDLYNGRIVRIGNSFVFKEPVYNYSSDFPFLWDQIKIPIKYGSDYKLARKILYDVAQEVVGNYSDEAKSYWDVMVKKYLIEDATTQPMVTMIANDNWVEFTLRFVVDYKRRVVVKDLLFTRILEKIENESKNIEMASATFELVEMPTIEVKTKL